MAEPHRVWHGDGSGKQGRSILLVGVVQADGSTADVYVQCQAAVDVEGRVVDQDAVLTVLLQMNKELQRMRKGIGDFIDNAEMMLDCDDGDEEDGDDDGGES